MWPVTLRCFISSAYAYMFAAADSIHFVAQVRNKGGLDSTRSCCLLVAVAAADVLFLHGACVFFCCYVTSFLRWAAPNQIRVASRTLGPCDQLLMLGVRRLIKSAGVVYAGSV